MSHMRLVRRRASAPRDSARREAASNVWGCPFAHTAPEFQKGRTAEPTTQARASFPPSAGRRETRLLDHIRNATHPPSPPLPPLSPASCSSTQLPASFHSYYVRAWAWPYPPMLPSNRKHLKAKSDTAPPRTLHSQRGLPQLLSPTAPSHLTTFTSSTPFSPRSSAFRLEDLLSSAHSDSGAGPRAGRAPRLKARTGNPPPLLHSYTSSRRAALQL